MSHSDKGIFAKRYKNTILVITFLFANRCKIQDNQKICDGICEGLKALIDCHQSNPASSTQKTKCHCVTYKFLKWQKNKIAVRIRMAFNCFVNMTYKLTQITCNDQYIIEI